MTMYQFAAEVADIAEDLIATVPRHEQLDGIRIEYLFIDKAPTSNGRVTLGRARKFGGLGAFLAARTHHADDGKFVKPVPFFVVEISWNTWHELKADQRIALVDHELCHLCVDGEEGDLFTRGHDLEEFVGIVQRYGFWKSDVADFSVAVAEQLTLDVDAVQRHIGRSAAGEDPIDDTVITLSAGGREVTLTAAELATAAGINTATGETSKPRRAAKQRAATTPKGDK